MKKAVKQDGFRNHEAMNTLARHLANNYFDVTFGYPTPPDYQDFYKRVLTGGNPRDFATEPRVRNILVVGAGASFAAFGGELCPLAVPAIDKLRSKLDVDMLQKALRQPDLNNPRAPDRFTEEEELVRQLHGIADPKADFESQLTILSKFYTPRQIRDVISRMYHHRYHPHILFETIAHLLKHRFIDVVINYNFDELLDQAVEEELRGGDHRFVLSDGDCEGFSRLMVAEQLKVPVYIKPHGTAGHKSSLRFTKDAYVGMPADLLEFTRKLLYGYTREDHEGQPHVDVNLISIGFAFNSVELVNMLKEHSCLSIFHINTPDLEASLSFQQQIRKLHPKTRHYFLNIAPAKTTGRGKAPSAPVAAENAGWPTLQHAMAALYKGVSCSFAERYRPRHLARHQLVHDLLFVPSTASVPTGAGRRVPSGRKHYFQARLLVELTLALAKGRGRLDLSGLVGDRVGTYFRLWQAEGGESLRRMCEKLHLAKDHGFAGNVYTLAESTATSLDGPASSGPSTEPSPEHPGSYWPLASILWANLLHALRQILDGPLSDHIAHVPPESIIAKLAQLAESEAHELTPRFEADTMLLLNNPRPEYVIPTALGLTTRLESLLRNSKWHLVLTITERAKLLPKVREHAGTGRPDRRVNVIVAEPLNRAALQANLDAHADLLIGPRYELPYWAHNEHMTIVLRRDGEEGEFTPLGAVAYRKRALEQRVTPVYIDNEDDLTLLVMTYFGYVVKAESAPTRGVPDVGFEEAEQKRKDLYREWWRAMQPGQ